MLKPSQYSVFSFVLFWFFFPEAKCGVGVKIINCSLRYMDSISRFTIVFLFDYVH